MKPFTTIASGVFALIALVHLLRIVLAQIPASLQEGFDGREPPQPVGRGEESLGPQAGEAGHHLVHVGLSSLLGPHELHLPAGAPEGIQE